MIKVFCDQCGTEIKNRIDEKFAEDEINISVGGMAYWDFHLCDEHYEAFAKYVNALVRGCKETTKGMTE